MSGRTVVWVGAPHPSSSTEAYWSMVLRQCNQSGIAISATLTDSYTDLVAALAEAERSVQLVLIRPDRIPNDELENQLIELVSRCHHLDLVVTLSGLTLFPEPYLLEIDHALIGADDLLFSIEDTRALFDLSDATLLPGEAETIIAATSGLPALVRSAISVVKDLPPQDRREDLLELNLQRAINKYIHEKILADPDLADHREFIVTCATARTLDVDTAGHLFKSGESREQVRNRLLLLETIGALSRIETEAAETWELAPAVRRSILALQAQSGIDPTQQMSSLSQYRLDSGRHASALNYAVEAHDWQLVVHIIEHHWVTMISDNLEAIRSALQRLPQQAVGKNVAVKAGRNLYTMHLTEKFSLLDTLPTSPEELRALGSGDGAKDALSVGCVQSIMLRMAGEYKQAAEITRRLSYLSRRALETNPDDVTRQLPIMHLQWGITFQLNGRFAESTIEMRTAYRGGQSQGADYIAINAAGSAAMNWAIVGEPLQSQRWTQFEYKHPDTHDRLRSMVKVSGLVARTLASLDTLDFVSADEALTALGQPAQREELWAFAIYAHCQCALARRDTFSALSLLHRAVDAHQKHLKPGSFAGPLMRSTEIDLTLALGDGNKASALASEIDDPADNPWTLASVARLRQKTGQNEAAVALCHQFDWAGESYPRAQMETLLVQAVAHCQLGEHRRAAEAWSKACSIADQTGNLRSFSTIALPDIDQLESMAKTNSSALAQFLKVIPAEAFPQSLQIVTLTERERTVLSLIDAGLSSAAMADKLFVSVNTIKTQLRTMYRKLGAHNRNEALTRARELRLL
ncbi:LuxR C-terminal-related transcriptional regulator [Rhodococcus sp. ARC_M6]|uniref:LuxR C-terminal-related transcriptional regulator n=1 Tax=Rhodococcus sp. ARC_M6 TaxID=2928852 RepID=UPI001FB4B037|nr:LuxR C-terminal-related transcriptional regulator [Rhodococcus sp. ARC_M6]MCJ0904580.1 LuxR C-terminal-related transcriptional regulator [Rhodococcus sp. ARC_M6]